MHNTLTSIHTSIAENRDNNNYIASYLHMYLNSNSVGMYICSTFSHPNLTSEYLHLYANLNNPNL